MLHRMCGNLKELQQRKRMEGCEAHWFYSTKAPEGAIPGRSPSDPPCFLHRFKVFADYEAYIKCQETVNALYKVRT